MIHIGVVEERSSDPLKIGRCKVRIFGLHTEDKIELPTKDLPWAYPVSSITSASFGGIGTSPTGLIEGSWVVIVFGDEFKQQPIILGSLIGVPVSESRIDKPRSIDPVINLVDTDNNTITDSDGNPIGTESNDSGTSLVEDLELSDAGRKFIHNEEALSSIERGRNRIAPKNAPDNTPIFAYQDTKNNWTIGWGSTFLADGSPVTSNTTLTKAECDALFEIKVKTEFEAGVKRNLSAPVSQSMYDALISMSYNMGVSGLVSSEMFKELNAGRYESAGALIPSTRANGLSGRRAREQKLFMSDGLPSKDGQTLEKTPATILEESKQETNPAPSNVGFSDSTGKYPKMIDEQDSNRLARRESESASVLRIKEASRVKDVKGPNDRKWTQPKIPYVAAYPHNHIRYSESGHIEEFDDTPNAERIHRYHRSGTYEEIDANGTQVNRIVGDSYSIIERNGHIFVKGNVAITVVGDADIRVQNDLNLDVLGDMKIKVGGSYSLSAVQGIKIKSDADINSHATANNTMEADAEIHLNSGYTVDIPLLDEVKSGRQEFSPFIQLNRYTELNSTYETPEEGSNEEFKRKHASKFDADEKTESKPKGEAVEVPPKEIITSTVSCEKLTDDDITPRYRLSPLFTLGDLLARGKSGYPKGTNFGMTSSEIVCNLKNLTVNCLDLVKAKYPNMIITSAWRSQAYNAHVRGSKTSDHLFGCAVDIQLTGFNRKQHYEAAIEIQKLVPTFKQLILEYKGSSTWLHLSYREGRNTNQCLTIDAAINKTLKSNGFVLA